MFSQEVIDIEQWGRLLKHPDFIAFEKHIEAKLNALRSEMESKYVSPSADRAYELIALTARIDELKKLMSRLDFNKHQFRKHEQEKQTK